MYECEALQQCSQVLLSFISLDHVLLLHSRHLVPLSPVFLPSDLLEPCKTFLKY